VVVRRVLVCLVLVVLVGVLRRLVNVVVLLLPLVLVLLLLLLLEVRVGPWRGQGKALPFS